MVVVGHAVYRICMPLEGALKVSSFEFPNFDGSVFSRSGELGVLGVEGERGDVAFVSPKFVLGWGFE